jgi:hypothetical protein
LAVLPDVKFLSNGKRQERNKGARFARLGFHPSPFFPFDTLRTGIMHATLRPTNQRSGFFLTPKIISISYSSASIGAALVSGRPSQEPCFVKQ